MKEEQKYLICSNAPPLDLKSGIPELVEMPAPLIITIFLTLFCLICSHNAGNEAIRGVKILEVSLILFRRISSIFQFSNEGISFSRFFLFSDSRWKISKILSIQNLI